MLRSRSMPQCLSSSITPTMHVCLQGGKRLLPMMNFRLATPAVIIDLNRVSDLAYIESDSDAVRIGSMTRQRAIEFSPIVAERIPLLREAIKLVGHLPTRSRGTIGGSIANADPAAELPMVLQALEGSGSGAEPKRQTHHRGGRSVP